MAYRQPAFMVENPYAELADISVIVDQNSELSDDDKRALIDYRPGEVAGFDTSAANHAINFAYPDASATINRLVIPAGHTIDAADVEVYSTAALPVTEIPGNSQGDTTVSGTGVIDIPLTSHTTRYRRVDFQGTGRWELGDVWLGLYVQLVTAAVDPGFGTGYESPRVATDFHTREAVLQLGPARRAFSLTVRNIIAGSADEAILDDVSRNGRFRPFYYWPPDDTAPGPFLVQLDREPTRRQDFPTPAASMRYAITLSMVEVTA